MASVLRSKMSNTVESSLKNLDPRLIQAMNLCSQQIDGEFPAAEVNLVEGGAASEDAEEFLRGARRLSRLLKSVPVIPVGRRLFDPISARVDLISARELDIASGTGAGQVESDRTSQQGVELPAGGTTTRVTVWKRPLRNADGWALPLALTMTLASLVLVSFMRTDQSLPGTAGDTSTRAKAVAAAGDRQASPVSLEGDDLQVLVLRVGAADREEVIRLVRSVAVANGLEVQSLEERHDHVGGDPLGVVVTSTDAGSQAVSFVDGMAETDVVRSWEWNPMELDAKARRELVIAIRQSMLNPTASELHFGEVYLAVPGASAMVAARDGMEPLPVSSFGSPSAVSDRHEVLDAAPSQDPRETRRRPLAAGKLPDSRIAAGLADNRGEPGADNHAGMFTGKTVRPAGRPVLVLFEFGVSAEPRHRSL